MQLKEMNILEELEKARRAQANAAELARLERLLGSIHILQKRIDEDELDSPWGDDTDTEDNVDELARIEIELGSVHIELPPNYDLRSGSLREDFQTMLARGNWSYSPATHTLTIHTMDNSYQPDRNGFGNGRSNY